MASDLPQQVKAFYERVSLERDQAMEQLPKLYAPNVRFINPVADKTGLEGFGEAWKKAFKQYKRFEFENVVVTGDEANFHLSYTMHIKFGIGPVFTTEMATHCQGANGQVVYCRDYFDPLGTLVGPFGLFRWLYQVIFRQLVA
ncbi:MAG: nuclear transport factor 2 family protein [Myxococcaceae bacterium]